MKKLLVFLFFFMLLVGCQEKENVPKEHHESSNAPNYNQASDDIVNMHGDIRNLDEFKKFIENVQQNKTDQIRIVTYTTEGDPMLHDLESDGKIIKSTRDTRRDKYGSGTVQTTECRSISIEKGEERTDYLLSDCNKANIDDMVLVTWNQ